jgi:hypothetical protein
MDLQLPFKLSDSCLTAKEANNKKGGGEATNKKRNEDRLFNPNTLETENHFKVAYYMVAFLIFFHHPDSCGKTVTGGTFMNIDKCRPAPLPDMWINILPKQPDTKLSIALTAIIVHQEMRPLDLDGVPSLRQKTFLSAEMIKKPRKGQLECRTEIQPMPEEMKSHFPFITCCFCGPRRYTNG